MMAPVGLAIAGPVADAVGLRTIWYISGGAIFLLFAAAFFSRDLMNIETQKTAGNKPEVGSPPLPKPKD